MEIDMLKTVKVNAKVLQLQIKVRDGFQATLVDAEGDTIKEYEGYVPAFMPGGHVGDKSGSHYGDYLILDIDIDTGTILNWKKLTAKDIDGFVHEEE